MIYNNATGKDLETLLTLFFYLKEIMAPFYDWILLTTVFF